MKRTGIILACIAVLVVIAYVSAAAGYLLGGPQYAARFMPADAAYNVVVLQALRRGDSESAISLLETQLDTQIVEHSTFNSRLASWLDPFPMVLGLYDLEPHPEAAAKLMSRVAAYRLQHPSSAPEEISSAINAHLAEFQPGSPAAQQGAAADEPQRD